jgi:hypothetical protein
VLKEEKVPPVRCERDRPLTPTERESPAPSEEVTADRCGAGDACIQQTYAGDVGEKALAKLDLIFGQFVVERLDSPTIRERKPRRVRAG